MIGERHKAGTHKPEEAMSKTITLVSDALYRLFVTGGVVAPILKKRATPQATDEALRVLDGLCTSLLLAQGLKRVVPAKRPDSGEGGSFPSGHAMASFAVATTQSALYPKQAALWYLGALWVDLLRAGSRRHHRRDVLGGAMLGYALARWCLSRSKGLLVAPLLKETKA